ncbi:mitochondrial basic amino acids transporter-like [Chelonus insularis]|uniref:mitochondrial basic amino acids transporter-like n=1 Tax=Chelonus insularis TaxID=460826 RepID=UPI00158CFCFB|nr:mitochondrial basic amino acids transporter-like [Chelonus insularis]
MVLDFVAGCLGGCAGLIVGYPLDTIKVHLQTQNSKNPQYRGTWHCFQSILAKESIAGFYKGISSPLAGVAVINAIVFGVYGQTQKHLIQNSDDLSSHFLAGAAAGLAQSPVTSPLELAKTRLQLQALQYSNFSSKNTSYSRLKHTHYSGPLQCLRKIYCIKGISGVFSGLTVTALREVPSCGLYFFTYEALIRAGDKSSTLHMLIAGGLAGTVSWVLTYPVDVIKSRLQADHQGQYTGAWDCYRQSIRQEGYRCLFKGLNSTIIRAFPTNAITFTVVQWTYRLCGDAEKQIDEIKYKLVEHEMTNESQLSSIILYNHSDGHRSSNINSQSYYHHHCNVLLNNFNSLFNSIIDNAHTFNLYCQTTTGGRENAYKSPK